MSPFVITVVDVISTSAAFFPLTDTVSSIKIEFIEKGQMEIDILPHEYSIKKTLVDILKICLQLLLIFFVLFSSLSRGSYEHVVILRSMGDLTLSLFLLLSIFCLNSRETLNCNIHKMCNNAETLPWRLICDQTWGKG